MRLQIDQIADRGVPNKERLILKVIADADLSFYITVSSKYLSSNGVSNSPSHAFWFPPTPVRAGDTVILFTGPGTQSERKANGNSVHYFYWGIKNTVWNSPDDCAVVFEISTWNTSRYENVNPNPDLLRQLLKETG